MQLQEWLKQRRGELKMTQAALGIKLGLHQAAISSFESGKIIPDGTVMDKITAIFGKFDGSIAKSVIIANVDSTVKDANTVKRMEALKAYRDSKEPNFYLQLDSNTHITADPYQYVLHRGIKRTYFADIKALMKHLVALKLRLGATNETDTLTPGIEAVGKIISKLDDIYAEIEKRFDGYDPAKLNETIIEDIDE